MGAWIDRICTILVIPIILIGSLIVLDVSLINVEDIDISIPIPPQYQQRVTEASKILKARQLSGGKMKPNNGATSAPTIDLIGEATHEIEIVLKAQKIDIDRDADLVAKYMSEENHGVVLLSTHSPSSLSTTKRKLCNPETDDDCDEQELLDGGDNNNNNSTDLSLDAAEKEDEEEEGEQQQEEEEFNDEEEEETVPHFAGEGFDLLADLDSWSEHFNQRFDLNNDQLFARSLPWASDSKSGKDGDSIPVAADVVVVAAAALGKRNEAPKVKAEPGVASKRFRERIIKKPPPEFNEFVKELRQRTYSHVSRYIDVERKLKELGYRQSAHKTKKVSAIVGYDGDSCPRFVPSDPQISFCTQFVPSYREQEQQTFLYMFQRTQKASIDLKVEDFFPLTWRLYKQAERRALRSRTSNESLPQEGGPYMNKYTFSHNAGTPSLTVKMWDQLKKSDHSEKLQVQEAKQKIIVQQYINKPYLFQSKKFVIRTWAVILNAKPMVVLYHDGALLRSIPTYTPFIRRDANYHRAAHFTNAQSSNKGTLRSSSLYASLGQFQQWLDARNQESPDFVKNYLRPRLKARMIYALYSMLRPPKEVAGERSEVKRAPALPATVVVIQPVCFDFLMDENKKIWLLGLSTGFCQVNLGGDSFRPTWKQNMQAALGDGLVHLAEEMLWRKVKKMPIKPEELFTDIKMEMLIDETFPGWDVAEEINRWARGFPLGSSENDGSEHEGAADEIPAETVDHIPEDEGDAMNAESDGNGDDGDSDNNNNNNNNIGDDVGGGDDDDNDDGDDNGGGDGDDDQ